MLLRRHARRADVSEPERENSLPGLSMRENHPAESAYTKTEINRMSTADLQTLAAEQGISGADEISGADLKKILIQKFNL